MEQQEMVTVIRKKYKEVRESLSEVEKQYNDHKRSHRKRAVFEFVSAQEMVLAELCEELGIELENEDFTLI